MSYEWVKQTVDGYSFFELTVPGKVVLTLEARPDY